MNNIEFNAYVTDIIAFVRSVVIKCEEVALVDNTLLRNSGVNVSSDKRTWRYYLNLNGQYHSADEIMYVKSLDDGTMIVFNKANLVDHVATARAYASSGYLYTQLINTYPAQRDLINGIINPIDLDTAINASNYKILKYDSSYIEIFEDQLISELQKWISSFTFQHFNTDYFVTDNLMLPIALATLYGLMTPAILGVREAAIGTRYVHSFHIWSRINSYGDFSRYKSVLTQTQALWLYRNIDWLSKNAGKNFTFNQLIENLLSVRSIPLSSFRLMSDTTTQLTDMTPTAVFKRVPLNLSKEQALAETYYSAKRIIGMEEQMALDNPDMSSTYLESLENNGKYALYSDAPIKLLESSMEDYTNRHDVVMMILLRDQWTYLASKNIYSGVIDITETSNGNQFRLTTKDAMVLWTYLTMKARGDDVSGDIPDIYYRRVAKVSPPTVDDLLKLGDNRFYVTPEIATTIASLKTDFPKIISSSVFYEKVREVYELAWQHKKLYSKFGDFKKQAEVRNACSAMYEDGLVNLSDVKTFKEWFTEKEIELGDLTTDELQALAWDIYQKATGFDVYGEDSLRYTQQALIDLMMQLSSYTIHTYVEIDDGYVTVEAGQGIGVSMDYMESNLQPDYSHFFLPTGLHIIPELGLQQSVPLPLVANDVGKFSGISIMKINIDTDISLTQDATQKPTTAFISTGIGLIPS